MTRDDIIRIAREAGIPIEIDWAGRPSTLVVKDGGTYLRSVDDLERFAALVAAEKEQQMTRDGWRQCAEGQRTTQHCGLLDAAVKAEREACAKVCERLPAQQDIDVRDECAAAIRARGEP
jgi:hypothetical protein